MRNEEVVVFTCGLMSDPSPLIHFVYNQFNDFNMDYIRYVDFSLHQETKERLNIIGKKTINSDFFQFLYAESKISLAGSPLQNPYCNYFQCNKDDVMSEDKLFLYLPSQHFEFRNLKQDLLFTNIKSSSGNAEKQSCSIFCQNPDPKVADNLILICCMISRQQSVRNLWLENIKCDNVETECAIELSSKAESLTIIDSFLPSALVKNLLHQLSSAPNVETIRLINVQLSDYSTTDDKSFCVMAIQF